MITRDRRAANRVAVAIQPWRVGFAHAIEIVDLSCDGARLRVIGDVETGDGFALAFAYRGREFTVPARVIWATPPADGADEVLATEVGVCFEDVPPLTRARLESVLDRRSR